MTSVSATPDRLTPVGVFVGITCLLVAASALPQLRIPVGGAAVHPYLLPMGLLTVFVGLNRIQSFPPAPLQAGIVFTALYLVAITQGRFDTSEALKIVASGATVVTVAVALRREADLRFAVLALVGAIAIISLRALLFGEKTKLGLNPLEEIANKNAFSLYALPAMLVGGWFMLRPGVAKHYRWMLGAGVGVAGLTIFATANRSGWLGVGLVVVILLFMRGSVRAAITLGVVGGLVYWIGEALNLFEVVGFRVEQTASGYRSDDIREGLFRNALQIGLENPAFGLGPEGLRSELARRLLADRPSLDPHNVLGHLIGGTGFLTTFALIAVGVALARLPVVGNAGRTPRALLRGLIFLFVVRGMFSREVLYSPAFTIAAGLCLAYWSLEVRAARDAQRQRQLVLAQVPLRAQRAAPSGGLATSSVPAPGPRPT